MPRPALHTVKQVIRALHKERGNVSAAARRLGIATQSLVQRAGRDPALKRAIKAARQKLPPCPLCGGTGVTERRI